MLVKQNDQFSYDLQSTPLRFVINNNVFEPMEVHGHYAHAQDLSFYLSALDIAGLAQVVPLFVEREKSHQLIEQLAPTGLAKNIYINQQQQLQNCCTVQ